MATAIREPIRANVWDSDDKVKAAIRLFTYVQVCPQCKKYFCELDNLGSHQCWYHPGKFDATTGTMSCCGEKLNGNHGSMVMNRYMNQPFAPRPQAFSLGCKRCDCVGSSEFVPYKSIDIRDIASLLPFMKNFETRPGFVKAQKNGDGLITRKELD